MERFHSGETCLCVLHARGSRGWASGGAAGVASKGFRSKHREHATPHAYSGSPFVVVLKKSMKNPLKGFHGHLSGSHSMFLKLFFLFCSKVIPVCFQGGDVGPGMLI